MKLVIAIIKPFKVEEVREAVIQAGVQGMTVTEVRGFGRQKGQPVFYRGAEYDTQFVPKVRIEVAVEDGMVDSVVTEIENAARTDTIGDGKIFVLDLEKAVRIRTGETGDDAL